MVLSIISIIDNIMLISSTQFQQNVGHYLKLVEEGEEVKVQRQKPKKHLFIIKSIEGREESKGISILDKVRMAQQKFSSKPGSRLGTDSVLDYQDKVRD